MAKIRNLYLKANMSDGKVITRNYSFPKGIEPHESSQLYVHPFVKSFGYQNIDIKADLINNQGIRI